VPLHQYPAFSREAAIEYIENADVPVVKLADQALQLTNVLEVHAGQSPLTQPYTGKGVIMGVIDDGIDFAHADFRNADSSTRIRYIWDQRATNVNSPLPYNYGREWTADQINAGICTHAEPVYNPGGYSSFGHGTTVAGIACGNGLATGKYIGVAPETDIIYVAINNQANFLSVVVDGIDYIFKKADALGKPCVVNISYGTYWGSRDGKDLASQLVDNLLAERSGRVVVTAAGNGGNQKYHLGYEVTADTNFTWFEYSAADADVHIALWADTADFNEVFFAVAADDWSDTANTLIYTNFFINIKTNYNIIPGLNNIQRIDYNISDSSNVFLASLSTQVTYENGRYLYELIIKPQNTSHRWRFITTGKGKFDLWGSPTLGGLRTAKIVEQFPNDSTFEARVPGIANYKYPDLNKTLVSSIQCSDRVLTVANYENRAWYLNANINPQTQEKDTTFTGFVTGKLNRDSSKGPTRDERQKPDVSAPGTYTLATGNRQHIAVTLGANKGFEIADDSLHNRNGGTSMASPVVAGIVALLLEANPEAWWYEIKNRVISSAIQDTFTGNNLPDNYWGYGKVNAFDALFVNAIYGCTNADALNFNSNAAFDDGSCILPDYGCLDANALNYDSLANVSDTCIYYVFNNVKDENSLNYFSLFPNPANDNISVKYLLSKELDAQLIISDVLGNIVYSESLKGSSGNVYIETSQFSKGVYVCRLLSENKTISVNKFLKY
jgi:subtilisin family serine protease